MVSVPYEITLLSNAPSKVIRLSPFQYLMKLHYSQTNNWTLITAVTFQYLMKLHYSQTDGDNVTDISRFQYLMKLHYSQTTVGVCLMKSAVSVPYEITLLSNQASRNSCRRTVSVPYEITLLSNRAYTAESLIEVSVPYEITLLSNIIMPTSRSLNGFSTL